MADDVQSERALPFVPVIPGLIFILFIDCVAILDVRASFEPYFRSWALVIAALPWITLLFFRKKPLVYGYRRKRALAIFGWGMLAGAIWRGLSLGFNYWAQRNWIQIGSDGLTLFGLLVWIPFVEETFFRAYLGGSLVRRFGRWPGIFIQAILFSFHPGHWSQGWLSEVSIIAFGLLSAWLYDRYQSIWAPWGAHAFANLLPLILRGFIV